MSTKKSLAQDFEKKSLPNVQLVRTSDAVIVVSAIVVAYLLRWGVPDRLSNSNWRQFLLALGIGASWLVALALNGAYEDRVLGNGYKEFERLTRATLWVFSTVAVISFSVKNETSRGFVLIVISITYASLFITRQVLRKWLRRQWAEGFRCKRTLIIQSRGNTIDTSTFVNMSRLSGYEVVETLNIDSPKQSSVSSENWIEEVTDYVKRNCIDSIIINEFDQSREAIRKLAWCLETPHVELLISINSASVFGPRISMTKLANFPLLLLEEPHLIGPKKILKRITDLFFGCSILLVLSPILLLSMLGVKITSRGPVFYSQERVGLGGQIFTVHKLRTMIQGADKMRDQVIGKPDAKISERYLRDPRITKFGQFLRRWSIDEIPQLFNVIVGNMSLVGPRPMLVDELNLLTDQDHRRHITNPGLTGLWQVSGRKQIDWEGRMRMDLEYIENWSPSLDIVIIFRTIKVVLTGHGAY